MQTAQSSSCRKAGFTLIEILVVITIIAALMSLAVPVFQNVQENSRVTVCANNLRQIATNLNLYSTSRNKDRWPNERGVKFLLTIARDDMIEKKDMKVFLCPGTTDVNGVENPADGSLYSNWDDIDPKTVSYAGRNHIDFKINKNRLGAEVIAADDNDGRGNHRSATNFVYADGTPASFDLKVDVRDRHVDLPEGSEWIPVGPDSPFEELQKLVLD